MSFTVRGFLKRLFMPKTAHPPMPFVFPETLLVIGVDTWANVVRRLDHETYPCHIRLLRYFKCRRDKKHEFLLVTIIHEPTGRTAIALVDRSPENVSQSGDGNSTPRLSQMASSSVNAHDQVRIKGSTDTKDVEDDYGQSDLLSTLRFTNRPTLLEFSTLLAVVHEHKPFYNPIFHQCYWHSHTIWRFLRDDKYGAVEEKKEKWSDRGVYVLIKMGRDSLEEIKAEHMVAFDSAKVEIKSRREEELARETAVSCYLEYQYANLT
jgi:hypothetical protein